MLAAGLCFALMGVCVKLGAPHFDTAEMVFWRSVLSMTVTALLLARAGLSGPHGAPRHARAPWRRGFVSLFMFFYSLTLLPVATAMTLNYTSPLFVALLFTWLARERLRRGLWLAVALGFVGAVLLLRPTITPEQVFPGGGGACLRRAVGGCVTGTCASWCAHRSPRSVSSSTRYDLRRGCAGLDAAHRWHAVTLDTAPILAGVGVFGTLGQLAMTRAYGKGPALVTAALSYSGIVFSSVLGIALFADALPWIAWLGIALIVAAGIIAVRLQPQTRADPAPQVRND